MCNGKLSWLSRRENIGPDEPWRQSKTEQKKIVWEVWRNTGGGGQWRKTTLKRRRGQGVACPEGREARGRG